MFLYKSFSHLFLQVVFLIIFLSFVYLIPVGLYFGINKRKNYMNLINIYTIQCLIVLIFFYKFKNFSLFVNVFDYPDKRKIHKNPTPLTGGIFITFNVVFLVFLFILFLVKNLLF